jgi:hypothetical protein
LKCDVKAFKVGSAKSGEPIKTIRSVMSSILTHPSHRLLSNNFVYRRIYDKIKLVEDSSQNSIITPKWRQK